MPFMVRARGDVGCATAGAALRAAGSLHARVPGLAPAALERRSTSGTAGAAVRAGDPRSAGGSGAEAVTDDGRGALSAPVVDEEAAAVVWPHPLKSAAAMPTGARGKQPAHVPVAVLLLETFPTAVLGVQQQAGCHAPSWQPLPLLVQPVPMPLQSAWMWPRPRLRPPAAPAAALSKPPEPRRLSAAILSQALQLPVVLALPAPAPDTLGPVVSLALLQRRRPAHGTDERLESPAMWPDMRSNALPRQVQGMRCCRALR